MPDRRKQLLACLTLLDRGVDAERAFQIAFGVPIAQLDQELRAYLEAGRFSVLALSLPAGEGVAPSVRRLDSAEALGALGDLAQHTRTSSRAGAAYADALRDRPNDPRLLSGLARSLPRSKGERRRALLQRALARGANDSVVQVDSGFVWLSEIATVEGELDPRGAAGAEYERAYQQAQLHFERSLALCRDCVEAESGLGQLLLLPGGDVSSAREHLEAAAQALPGHFPIQLALASAYLRSGAPDLASRMLRRQLQNAHETRWRPRIAQRLAEAEAAVQAK
jgi:tetratricopeptide (TPR) repeat protein